MLAPNMTLELGVRESVHSSSNSQRLEQKTSQPSSFERALERARSEKSEKVGQPEQSEKPQEQAPVKDVKKVAQGDEAAPSQEVDRNPPEQELAKDGAPRKSLELALVVEEDVLVPDAQMPGELEVAEELNPGTPSKDSVLKKLISDEASEKKDTPLVEAPEEGALVLAESLAQATEMQESHLEKTGTKTKKPAAEDVDYSIAQILQGSQQPDGVPGSLALAEGAMAEMQGDVKALRLETGTSLDQKIQVQDFRTAVENGVTEASLKDGNFVSTVNLGEGAADITVQLTNGGEAGAKASAIPSGGKESSFGAMLSSQLQNNATEIVRTGSIILRDGNMGTINLVLHPEELGNVKISLELNDRMVSAQIRVASEEAYMALKDSISSIKQAFADSGFDTGSFDLSWSGNGQQQQGGQQNQNQGFVAFANTLYGEMMAEDSLESGTEGENLQKKYSDSSQVAVNIMA